jgi:hypothetical protein
MLSSSVHGGMLYHCRIFPGSDGESGVAGGACIEVRFTVDSYTTIEYFIESDREAILSTRARRRPDRKKDQALEPEDGTPGKSKDAEPATVGGRYKGEKRKTKVDGYPMEFRSAEKLARVLRCAARRVRSTRKKKPGRSGRDDRSEERKAAGVSTTQGEANREDPGSQTEPWAPGPCKVCGRRSARQGHIDR